MGKKIRAIFRGIIYDSAEADPYKDDEIKLEILRRDSREGEEGREEVEEVEEVEAQLLDEYLEIFDCGELLPFANWIIFLGSVKEAIGHIPTNFELTYEEIKALVILADENMKKQTKEMQESRHRQSQAQSHSQSQLQSQALSMQRSLNRSR